MGLWEHFNKCVGPLHWFVSSFTLGAGNQSQRRCSDCQGDPIQHWSLYDVNLSSLALSEYPLPPSIQPSEILPWKVLGVRMLIWSHLNVIKQTRQDKTAWSKMTEGEMLKGMIGSKWRSSSKRVRCACHLCPWTQSTCLRKFHPSSLITERPHGQ